MKMKTINYDDPLRDEDVVWDIDNVLIIFGRCQVVGDFLATFKVASVDVYDELSKLFIPLSSDEWDLRPADQLFKHRQRELTISPKLLLESITNTWKICLFNTQDWINNNEFVL